MESNSSITLKVRNYYTNDINYYLSKELEYLILENNKIYLSVEVINTLVKK